MHACRQYLYTHPHTRKETLSHSPGCDLSPGSIRGLSCLRNVWFVFLVLLVLTALLTHISPLVFSFLLTSFSLLSPLFSVLLPRLPPPAEKVTYCLQWWGAQWAPGGWCQLLWEPGEVLIRGTKRHQCVGGWLAPRVSRWAPRRGHRELKPHYCHQVMRKEHCLMQSWAAREWDQYLAKARLWPTHI